MSDSKPIKPRRRRRERPQIRTGKTASTLGFVQGWLREA